MNVTKFQVSFITGPGLNSMINLLNLNLYGNKGLLVSRQIILLKDKIWNDIIGHHDWHTVRVHIFITSHQNKIYVENKYVF